MKYIICALALFLTACLPHEMSAEEIASRKAYCGKVGAKQHAIIYHNKTKGVLEIRCVFDGYETPSEYVEEKK